MESTQTTSGAATWTSRILKSLCILFLLLDAIMKIIKEKHSVEGSVQLGWPEQYLAGTGIILLICTILYSIPRTAVAGAVAITAYLGGAVAIMARGDVNGHPYIFPIVFGIVIWIPLLIRDEQLRSLLSLKK